jgi:hypothetical protein
MDVAMMLSPVLWRDHRAILLSLDQAECWHAAFPSALIHVVDK